MRKLEVSSTMPASIESTGIKNADTEVGEDRSHLKHRTRDEQAHPKTTPPSNANQMEQVQKWR
jgi:hypothetical protein